MKIVLAPDKFKGSLDAMAVCQAMEAGIKQYDSEIEVVPHPLADGGEGSLAIIDNSMPLKTVSLSVQGPRFQPINAYYKVGGDTAYIEMATASGLQLLDDSDKNCFYTTTYGTGQLIKHAINQGIRKIVLFIGGSATNDVGIGVANALGYKFYDDDGRQVRPIGKELSRIKTIDESQLIPHVSHTAFTVVTDVKNVLHGDNGAAHIYGAQKGASKAEIIALDNGMKHFNNVLANTFGRSFENLIGGGAAGGLGTGMVAFFKADIKSGIDTIMDITNFQETIKGANFIFTGEGKLDNQSVAGKVIDGVCKKAKKHQIPVGIICGRCENLPLISGQISAFAIHELMSGLITADQAMKEAFQLIAMHSKSILKSYIRQNQPN